MLVRKAPLSSGTDTEIDLIEREMLGGVVVERPIELHERYVVERLGGLVEVEEEVDIRQLTS